MSEQKREKSIIFSGAMVNAILRGRKTQTRRVMKPQPSFEAVDFGIGPERWQKVWMFDPGPKFNSKLCAGDPRMVDHCPWGRPGDRLWVRENIRFDEESRQVRYAADDAVVPGWKSKLDETPVRDFLTAFLMPHWAARIILEITAVSAQRLQEIKEHDALAEGVGSPITRDCKVPQFMRLWDEINGRKFPWQSNPWVWAITFRLVGEPRRYEQPE